MIYRLPPPPLPLSLLPPCLCVCVCVTANQYILIELTLFDDQILLSAAPK